MTSLRRLFAIVVKELRQLRRDRLTFAMIVGLPTIQLLLFGYAINMDVRNLDAALVDQADTHASRAIAAELAQSQVVNVRYRMRDPAAIESLVRAGKISVAIVLPPDFDRRLARRDRAAMQVIVDGSDPVIQQAARQLASIPLGGGIAAPPVETLTLYNPERRSALNTVPGLVGVILTMTMVLFTAVAIVRERERGNLELLITTPVRSIELMAGKIVPYVAIGLLQVTLILIVASTVFRVPIRGRVLDLYLAALVFIAASLALGLLISTAAKTQFQSVQMTIFFFLPSILLSGFMFPFVSMPRAAQMVGELLPLTHFVRIVRGVVLRGAPLYELRGELLPLLGFFAVCSTLAILRFRKRLD